MSTFRRLLPWMILGPITGLLAEGVYRNIKAKNPGLAWLYAIATVVTWINLATYGGDAMATLKQWIAG